ncbi:PREDICTED: uncharacterized protein LOC109486004 [Branchiostoma belcheri]|uniref:Uncharacterized protein LOC109486004 n=1 Tax=Branchiostoma belcheri TaxID=7741 RepID=A0A6P5AFX3_BRABE|nr:PREDICTED: uncharacterized protein LOC109486004 [Branchiostoma belcheri]
MLGCPVDFVSGSDDVTRCGADVLADSGVVHTGTDAAVIDIGAADCQTGGGVPYRGTVSVTESGRTCQRWDSQTPHNHPYTAANYPAAGLEQNYCRNPEDGSRVWCYTTDPSKRWENCDVPVCVCGGTLTCPPRGTLTSPNYPNNYGNGWRCEWWLIAPEGSTIRLTFDRFHLEERYDFFYVYDGDGTSDWRFIQRLTGELSVGPINSTSNRMFLRFTSDFSTTEKGFALTYTDVSFATLTTPSPTTMISVAVEQSPFDCFFESNLCNWTQFVDDEFDWTRRQGPTDSMHTGPTVDHTMGTDQGWYMYIEASSPRVTNDSAVLLSTDVPANQGKCLRFWYHMYGAHVGVLNVKLYANHVFSPPVWTRQGAQGDAWRLAYVAVTGSATQYQIALEGKIGTGHEGDIAVDDIIVTNGACPVIDWSHTCYFDLPDICGFTQDETDDFDWKHAHGTTGATIIEHSTDNGAETTVGTYMYIETSSPRQPGDIARLISSPLPDNATSCLRFYYHMYGDGVGTLNVYGRDREGNILDGTMWSKSNAQNNQWLKGYVPIPQRSQTMQIVFEGVCGHGPTGGIAIDDVQLHPGDCSLFVTPTATPTPFNGATQSSTYVHGPYGPLGPDHAVDGIFITNVVNCTHTQKGDYPPWWKVDLGGSYTVSQVRVLNRGDCCGERLQNLMVRVGENENFLQNSQCGETYTDTPTNGQTILVYCDPPISGRYVSIQLVEGRVTLTLCEVEVYGPDPVGLWPLNLRYGTSDITGNGNDAVASGAQLAFGPHGLVDDAYLFSGNASSYIDIPNNGNLDVRFSFTILAHVFPTGEAGPIFDFVPGNAGRAVGLWQTSPRTLSMWIAGRDVESTSNFYVDVLQQNDWNYVGGTYDSNTGVASLWYNGDPVSQIQVGVVEVASQYSIRVAKRDGDSRIFAGKVACLQLYNYALTKEQIVAARHTCRGKPY